MVVETTKFNPYDIVDYGLQIFIGLLVLMFLTWCIFQIVKYCKIIRDTFLECKVRQSELQDIQKHVNQTLSEIRKQGDVE